MNNPVDRAAFEKLLLDYAVEESYYFDREELRGLDPGSRYAAMKSVLFVYDTLITEIEGLHNEVESLTQTLKEKENGYITRITTLEHALDEHFKALCRAQFQIEEQEDQLATVKIYLGPLFSDRQELRPAGLAVVAAQRIVDLQLIEEAVSKLLDTVRRKDEKE